MGERGAPVSEAFLAAASTLAARLDADGGTRLIAEWRNDERAQDEAARQVAKELSLRCQSRAASEALSSAMPRRIADVVMVWAESASDRSELLIAPLLGPDTAARRSFRARAAKARLMHGPLSDALHSVPAAWDSDLGNDGRLRLRQLIWEAGARGLTLPKLGRWAWSVPQAVSMLIADPARGHLGDRVLAARAFAVLADGFVEDLSPSLTRVVLAAGIELRDHPEPAVWRAAACGLARFTEGSQSARMAVFHAATDKRLNVRRRNVASIAAMPATLGAEGWIYEQLGKVFDPDARKEDPFQLPALAVATPHLARERPDVWDRLCKIALEEPSLELTWSLAQGLAMVARHGGGRGWEANGERVALALQAQLRDYVPTAPNEVGRKVEALTSLHRALGSEPDVVGCVDAFDARIRGDIERVESPEPPIPRVAFDEAIAEIHAPTDLELGIALYKLRSATRAHAMHLPELVLGLSVREDDTEEMMQACRARLASEVYSFPARAALVGAITDLVTGSNVHGRDAARALRAIAESRWALQLGEEATDAANDKQVSRDIKRFRKPLEDLFEACLASRPALLAAEVDATVPPVVAVWWAICAGPAAVLGRIDRTARDPDALAKGIANLERILRDAVHLSAREWGPRLIDAVRAMGAADTVLAEVLARLVSAIADAEDAGSADEDEARRVLGALSGATCALVALGANLDEALAPRGTTTAQRATVSTAPAWVSSPARAPMSGAASDEPWERLAPALRALVAPLARALVEKFKREPAFVAKDGVKIGDYVLVRKISDGGMGSVWHAQQLGMPKDTVRHVAIKLPKLDVDEDDLPRVLDAIEVEAANLASLSIARVAPLLGYGRIGDMPFFATQLIRGRTLQEHLIDDEAAAPTGRHLPLVQRIVNDICKALRGLHSNGVVHRDLKPSNVMLQMRGRLGDPLPTIAQDPNGDEIDDAILIDLGIAHQFYASGPRGFTLGYAAPEQTLEETVGPAADIYALGAMLFHMLTGRLLPGKRGQLEAWVWHGHQEPFEDADVVAAAKSLPPRLRDAIEGACRLQPERRIPLEEFRRLVCRF